MPLIKYQQEIIEQSIEHLIETPEEKNQLIAYIKTLKTCLTEKAELKNPEETLLQKCFFESTSSFNSLESSHPEITQGEVQIAILKYITRRIKEGAKKINYELTLSDWNEDEVILSIKKGKSYNQLFETIPTITVEEHPYFLTPEGRRFSVHFIPELEPPLVTLNCVVRLSSGEIETSEDVLIYDFLDEMVDVPGSNDDLIASSRFSELILEYAEKKLGRLLLEDLIKSKIIEGYHSSKCSDGALALLTHDVFYNAIRTTKISFNDVAHIQREQVETIVALKQADLIPNKLSVSEVIALTAPERILISHPFYSQAIKLGSIAISYIKGINQNDLHKFNLPCIINLLQINKISFDNVKRLSPVTCELLSNEYYFDAVKKNILDVSVIMTISKRRGDILLNQKILQLIVSLDIPIKTILKMKYRLYNAIISSDLLFYYLQHNILKLQQLNTLLYFGKFRLSPVEGLSLIEITSAKQFINEFMQLVQNRLLLMSDLMIYHSAIKSYQSEQEQKPLPPLSILSLFPTIKHSTQAHAKERFTALLNHCPVKLHDNTFDTISKLKKNCEEVEIDFSFVRDALLIPSIHLSFYNKLKDYLFFYHNRKELNLTDEALHGKILGMRLFAIFLNKPYFVDGARDILDNIRKTIRKTSDDLSIPPVNLQVLAFEYLLKKLLEELQTMNKVDSHATMLASQKMITIITSAETEAKTMQPDIPKDLSPWLDAFNSLQKIASSREIAGRESYLEEKNSSFKRLKLSTSSYCHFHNSHQKWYYFCEQLKALSELTIHTYTYQMYG